MKELRFTREIKDNLHLRKSFNRLALSVFGIQFEDWHQHGFWSSRYDPFAFAIGEEIVANVSVNKLALIINGEKMQSLQIGTVMTKPEYRNQGLSRNLLEMILAEFEGQYDLMYLFANHSVLDFYPKFGFERIQEHHFSSRVPKCLERRTGLIKLDGTNKADLEFIHSFSKDRVPSSDTFGTVHTEDLLMFHCMNVYPNNIFYLEAEDSILIYEEIGKVIHVYDVISKKKVSMETILPYIAGERAETAVFHFTPGNDLHVNANPAGRQENILFVRNPADIALPQFLKHPVTAMA